jgi:acetyl-CoA carboxylase biotin carboxylase subunit
MFRKILIANRGEIAVRVLQTCRTMGIQTVAVYSDADANAPHVRYADEAVRLGAAPSAESYLRSDKIIEVARQTGAEAIHPGYGFLSENAAFAEAVARAGIVFIGPAPSVIRRMGSKTEARYLMESAGVPIVPGYQGEVTEFRSEAQKIGYPVLIKAAGGGGGKGMRVVKQTQELREMIQSAQRESANAFGDDTVFLEKYLPVAHHVEFQILGDRYGNIVHLFERECSIQRRHQKIIEETPSPLLTDRVRREMGAAAVMAAKTVGYENAGTVEFIVDEAGHFYFLEMNTRLQVEHPITEMVTGLDLVRLQLMVAAGEPLPFAQKDLVQRGHALECRVYAEDPANDFLPSTGKVLFAETPELPNVRVDTGVETGTTITIHYDPMVAKVITYGATREESIERMQIALSSYTLLGVTTNIPFLQAVLDQEAFRHGETRTDFIPRHLADWTPPAPAQEILDLALIAAAIVESAGTPPPPSPTDREAPHDPWNKNDAFRLGGD